MIDARLDSLQRRHAHLEAALFEEESHPYHDPTRIHDLKLAKLHVKEEMYPLQQAANSNRKRA